MIIQAVHRDTEKITVFSPLRGCKHLIKQAAILYATGSRRAVLADPDPRLTEPCLQQSE